MIKKVFVYSIAIFFGCCSAAMAQEKVVVVPLNKSNVAFENVSHVYSISGTTFQPIRLYFQTEENGFVVTGLEPGIQRAGKAQFGVAHNASGGSMIFTAPVHLPDGARIGHIGAAICAQNNSLTNLNVRIELVKTDMTLGEDNQTSIRQALLTDSQCGISQGTSGIIATDIVDNSKYAYEFKIHGVEGGTCSGSICEDRRTRIQFAHVNYTSTDAVQP